MGSFEDLISGDLAFAGAWRAFCRKDGRSDDFDFARFTATGTSKGDLLVQKLRHDRRVLGLDPDVGKAQAQELAQSELPAPRARIILDESC